MPMDGVLVNHRMNDVGTLWELCAVAGSSTSFDHSRISVGEIHAGNNLETLPQSFNPFG